MYRICQPFRNLDLFINPVLNEAFAKWLESNKQFFISIEGVTLQRSCNENKFKLIDKNKHTVLQWRVHQNSNSGRLQGHWGYARCNLCSAICERSVASVDARFSELIYCRCTSYQSRRIVAVRVKHFVLLNYFVCKPGRYQYVSVNLDDTFTPSAIQYWLVNWDNCCAWFILNTIEFEENRILTLGFVVILYVFRCINTFIW